MLEHTIYLQQKQGGPLFIYPRWYGLLQAEYNKPRDIITAAKNLGLPEAQVREATYDLWRLGFVARREVVNEYGRVYLYCHATSAWYDDFHFWDRWQPTGDHAEALRVMERFAWDVTMHDVARATDWTLDHTKRIMGELWRARRIERIRHKEGKSWWYEYRIANHD